MLLKIAWRNIWRSKVRSLVVILSIAVGVWALAFILSFSVGMVAGYIDNAIRDQWSHIQVHHPKFPDDKLAAFYIPNIHALLDTLQAQPAVQSIAPRTISTGMISSSRSARGLDIIGVYPEWEAATTHLDQKIVEGDYFSADHKSEILISKRTADKLKVGLRNRVVLTFQNLDGTITSAAFRVAGLFSSGNMLYDESRVFVKANTFQPLLLSNVDTSISPDQLIHEVAIFLHHTEDMPAVVERLHRQFPDLLVQDYRKLSPDVELYESQIQLSNTIMITIFMVALIFGIINTMLMAVLERYRELGMLMAIGMNKQRVFGMIVLETLMLGLVAAPVGLALGWTTVYALEDTGLDLSAFSKGLERFGIDSVIYPVIDPGLYLQLAVAVFITALLASIYPAMKAIRLRPVEALQKV